MEYDVFICRKTYGQSNVQMTNKIKFARTVTTFQDLLIMGTERKFQNRWEYLFQMLTVLVTFKHGILPVHNAGQRAYQNQEYYQYPTYITMAQSSGRKEVELS